MNYFLKVNIFQLSLSSDIESMNKCEAVLSNSYSAWTKWERLPPPQVVHQSLHFSQIGFFFYFEHVWNIIALLSTFCFCDEAMKLDTSLCGLDLRDDIIRLRWYDNIYVRESLHQTTNKSMSSIPGFCDFTSALVCSLKSTFAQDKRKTCLVDDGWPLNDGWLKATSVTEEHMTQARFCNVGLKDAKIMMNRHWWSMHPSLLQWAVLISNFCFPEICFQIRLLLYANLYYLGSWRDYLKACMDVIVHWMHRWCMLMMHSLINKAVWANVCWVLMHDRALFFGELLSATANLEENQVPYIWF